MLKTHENIKHPLTTKLEKQHAFNPFPSVKHYYVILCKDYKGIDKLLKRDLFGITWIRWGKGGTEKGEQAVLHT